MNAKQRRMRVSKRTYCFVEGMICKKSKLKSKKQKQCSKIKLRHFSKKIKEYFAKHKAEEIF